jgi:hypothetical protein
MFELARMEQAVRCKGEASSSVQSGRADESGPLLSDRDSYNSSHNNGTHVDDANEESKGSDE